MTEFFFLLFSVAIAVYLFYAMMRPERFWVLMQLEILAIVFAVVVACATSVPIGLYMARVFTGERTWLDRLFVTAQQTARGKDLQT